MTKTAPPTLDPPGKEWRHFAAVFHRLRSPLRPVASDVARISGAIAGSAARVLLLGVTPELARLGESLVAVDNSPRMLAAVWPGDDDAHRALLGDWTALPFAARSFDAVIGDGALNSVPGDEHAVLGEIRRVLAPAGRAAIRNFCAPESPERLDAIRADALGGRAGNVHALKWRIAMSLAAERRNAIVSAHDILAAFDTLFPDRAAVSAATGWADDDIATLDAYRGAGHSLGFPTERRLLEQGARHFGACDILPGTGYPLAERCPVMVWHAAI